MIRQWHCQRGFVWIGLGLVLVVLAQIWSFFPVVTAIALVGQGAIMTLWTRPRTSYQDSLIVLNLTVYGVLVCLAIVAQSNAVLQDSTAQVTLAMLLDHAAAIVLLAGLIMRNFYRLCQPTQ